MRFSVQLPTERVDAPDEFLTAEAVAEMAEAAERAGFDACFVTDHPIPGDRWLRAGGHHALDPFVALSFAASATSRLRLQTHVLVLPYRNPFLTAKAAASLDVLSGGRLILGVAAGYLAPEFEALGVDYEERNTLTDEAIDVMRRAWSEDGLVLEGSRFRATGNTARPRPRQARPPIWVGGNSRRAIRRAVERGDGWLPFPAPARMAGAIRTAALESLDELRARLDYARRHAETLGRTAPLDVCFVPFSHAFGAAGGGRTLPLREEIQALAELGVTWLTFNVTSHTRAAYCDEVAALGDQVRGART